MLLNISCRFVNLAYFRSGIGNVVVKLKAGFCISDRLVAADTEPQGFQKLWLHVGAGLR